MSKLKMNCFLAVLAINWFVPTADSIADERAKQILSELSISELHQEKSIYTARVKLLEKLLSSYQIYLYGSDPSSQNVPHEQYLAVFDTTSHHIHQQIHSSSWDENNQKAIQFREAFLSLNSALRKSLVELDETQGKSVRARVILRLGATAATQLREIYYSNYDEFHTENDENEPLPIDRWQENIQKAKESLLEREGILSRSDDIHYLLDESFSQVSQIERMIGTSIATGIAWLGLRFFAKTCRATLSQLGHNLSQKLKWPSSTQAFYHTRFRPALQKHSRPLKWGSTAGLAGALVYIGYPYLYHGFYLGAEMGEKRSAKQLKGAWLMDRELSILSEIREIFDKNHQPLEWAKALWTLQNTQRIQTTKQIREQSYLLLDERLTPSALQQRHDRSILLLKLIHQELARRKKN